MVTAPSSRKLRTPIAYLRPEVIAASFAINLLALAIPLVVLQTYDRLIPSGSRDTLAMMMVAIAVAIALDAGLRVGRAVLLSWSGMRFEHTQFMRVLEHLLHVDLAHFESRPRGAYLDQLHGLEQVREYYHGQSMLLLMDLPFVVLFLGLIWAFADALVLVPLVLISAFLIISMISARMLKSALATRSRNYEQRQNYLLECLSGIHTLKSLAMEPQMQRRYERLQGQSAEALHSLSRLTSLIQALGVTFSQSMMVTFVSLGAWFAVIGELSVGALAAGTMLAGRVLQPSLKAMGTWTQLQSVRLAQERFNELLSLPSEAVEDKQASVDLRGSFELRKVKFQYPGAPEPILHCVNLKVEPGEVIGITGPNGSGKSTLLDLIMGFESPSEGEILLDGRDLRLLDRSSIRAQVGLVPQRGSLFSGTLMENMTLFREGRAVDDAVDLMRKLGMQSAITLLPEGLDTPVGGDSNHSLSEGFRQRVIMVRALLGDLKIVLFDDANAAFDQSHDVHLMRLLESMKGKQTQVLISHRPSVLQLCDRVFELDDGWLMEQSEVPEHTVMLTQPVIRIAPASRRAASL